MNTITDLTVTLPVTTPITARNWNNEEFTVNTIWWEARATDDLGYTTVTLIGTTASGEKTNATLYPDMDDVTHLPHPGLWFDELAKQIAGQVTR